ARKAVALARVAAVDPNSSAWIGEALVWRARSEAALGKTAAAVQSAREALPHLEANLDLAHPLIFAATHMVGAAPSGTYGSPAEGSVLGVRGSKRLHPANEQSLAHQAGESEHLIRRILLENSFRFPRRRLPLHHSIIKALVASHG